MLISLLQEIIIFFYNFVNCGPGNAELPGDIRCTSLFVVKLNDSASVEGTPASKPDAFQLCFLPALIGAL